MPVKPCASPGCRRLLPVGVERCADHAMTDKVERDRFFESRRSNPEARRWYKTAAWRKRRLAQLAREPICRFCPEWSKQPATVADHVTPHRGNHGSFWFGELQSLCKACHDGKKQRIERRGGGSKV